MGSRGRSIRLRIYFLVAIPLVALVGLLAYVAGTTINSAISVDRAPNLVNATAIPAAEFGTFLEAERTAAVVYLFQPDANNLAAYQAATAATDKAEPAFVAAMNSEGTTGTEDTAGAKAVSSLVSGLEPAPHPAQRGQGAGPQPAGRPGRLQPGHHDPDQAVPDPDRERDRQLPADPGRRADRHRPGQGAALAGARAAVRDAGHASGSRRRTGSRSPTWPRPGPPTWPTRTTS